MARFEFDNSPLETRTEELRHNWKIAGARVMVGFYRLDALLRKFDPNQPRVPRGNSDGGRWTGGGGGTESGEWTRVADAEGTTSRTPGSSSRPRVSGNGTTTSRASRASAGSNSTTTLHSADGSSETRAGGTRSWRNNNPHNIVPGPFANAHGAIGSAGGMAIFPDEATGEAAGAALLRTRTYSGLTIDQAIARRSPPNENDTPAVQRNVRRIGNFSGNEIVGQLGPAELARLIRAIQFAEGWREGTVTRTPGQSATW